MRKNGLSKVMVRAVMSLYDGTKTSLRVGSAYSEKFEVKVGVQFSVAHKMRKMGLWQMCKSKESYR